MALLFLGAGRLSDPSHSLSDAPDIAPPVPHPERALAVLRAQDFTPVLDAAGRRVAAYFDDARQAAFLDEVFSLRGKWKLATRSRASYEKAVRRAFERHVHRPEDFRARVLDPIQDDLAFALLSAENRLLVTVFEDLRAWKPSLEFAALRAEHAGLVDVLTPLVARDLGINLVAVAAGEAAASLFSAGLAAAGVTSGPWTFGIGLAAGLAAGIAVDATAGAAWEDAARAKVRTEVNALRNRLMTDVDDALSRALLGWRRAQEEAVTRLYTGEAYVAAH
ncbi:MAG TPA: hypothetical protein VF950_18065 [Planctomycetota bacterium]